MKYKINYGGNDNVDYKCKKENMEEIKKKFPNAKISEKDSYNLQGKDDEFIFRYNDEKK